MLAAARNIRGIGFWVDTGDRVESLSGYTNQPPLLVTQFYKLDNTLHHRLSAMQTENLYIYGNGYIDKSRPDDRVGTNLNTAAAVSVWMSELVISHSVVVNISF